MVICFKKLNIFSIKLTCRDSGFQIIDDKGIKRRFRASNFQVEARVKPFICITPMRLDNGWNQVQFNLADFVRRAYGTNYVETTRITVRDIKTN